MFNSSNLFNALLVIPILNILVAVYKLFLAVKMPGALGFSLISLTVLIRLILYPLTISQLKNTHKLSKLKPHLDGLSKKHKDDKQKLHQEQLKLYQKEGINPAAGCLPLLIQMPILIALYNLFFRLLDSSNLALVVEEINKVIYFPFLKIQFLELSFFGLNLASKPSEWQKIGWWLLAVPVATAVLQYWQTRLMSPHAQSPVTSHQLSEKKIKKEGKKEEDMGTTMQKQMGVMMPLMIGFFAYSFPMGLSLYWNTFTIFGIIQQYQVNNQLNNENENEKT